MVWGVDVDAFVSDPRGDVFPATATDFHFPREPRKPANEDTFQAVLDAFAAALCILDANRSVRRMNAAAHEQLARGEALQLREGRLAGSNTSATMKLSTAVGEVCRMSRAQHAFQLCGAHPGLNVQVQVRALGSFAQAVDSGEGLALVLFAQTSSERYDLAMLRCLFGLSKAESYLLDELLRGKRLDECATSRHVTMGTARTQLKSIFMKTGASSQGQLIAIVKTLPAAAPPHGLPGAVTAEDAIAGLPWEHGENARLQERGAGCHTKRPATPRDHWTSIE